MANSFFLLCWICLMLASFLGHLLFVYSRLGLLGLLQHCHCFPLCFSLFPVALFCLGGVGFGCCSSWLVQVCMGSCCGLCYWFVASANWSDWLNGNLEHKPYRAFFYKSEWNYFHAYFCHQDLWKDAIYWNLNLGAWVAVWLHMKPACAFSFRSKWLLFLCLLCSSLMGCVGFLHSDLFQNYQLDGRQVMELLGTMTKSTHFSFFLQGPGFWVMGWNLSCDHAFCLITTL